METVSRLVDLGDFYLQVPLIRKKIGMTLGAGPVDENQPPTLGVRRRRCYNCQEEGHLRHQCSRPSREARVLMGVLSENPLVGTNDGRKRTYRDQEPGQPTTSVPLRPDTNIDRHPPT
ncbi:unnamed protein product [Gordionus sp. m RMFG-2023]